MAHREADSRVRTLRQQVKESKTEYDKTEDDLKALQSVGQIVGEVLRQLDEERCTLHVPTRWMAPTPPCVQSSSRQARALATSWAAATRSIASASPLGRVWHST